MDTIILLLLIIISMLLPHQLISIINIMDTSKLILAHTTRLPRLHITVIPLIIRNSTMLLRLLVLIMKLIVSHPWIIVYHLFKEIRSPEADLVPVKSPYVSSCIASASVPPQPAALRVAVSLAIILQRMERILKTLVDSFWKGILLPLTISLQDDARPSLAVAGTISSNRLNSGSNNNNHFLLSSNLFNTTLLLNLP
jgi:hypothetical protein